MSENLAPTPTSIPPLPEPAESKSVFTFAFPHILLGISRDERGFVQKQIREGESRQVEFTTRIEYSDVPVVEESVFSIKAQHRLQIGGHPISVLNDEVQIDVELRMPASAPTASEYLAQTGKPVLIAFRCERDINLSKARQKPAYRTARTTIILL